MASYFDEHSSQHDNDHLSMARLLFESGWNEAIGLQWDQVFHGQTKPTCQKAIADMERCRSDQIETDGQCPVCIAWWSEGSEGGRSVELIRLPCHHLFHSSCILTWLEKTNTCPVCRNEMPSDNALYEEYKQQQKRKEAREKELEELHDSMFS